MTERLKETIKVLKYYCFRVTLKISLLLANNISLFNDSSLLIQHMLILSVLFLLDLLMWKMRVTQR